MSDETPPKTLSRWREPGWSATTTVAPAVRVAAAWSWRLLLIAAGVVGVAYVLGLFSEITIPVVIGLLLCSLLSPLPRLLRRARIPQGPAALISVLLLIIVVAGALTIVGTTVTSGVSKLIPQVTAGFTRLRELAKVNWNISDTDVQNYLTQAKNFVLHNSGLGSKAAEVGTSATHLLAGIAITLFSTFFFLYQGPMIWGWLVRLFPRTARDRVDSSGRHAWVTLTAYVRATVVVAAVDTIGITIGAVALQLPLVGAIALLVFIGAFIPVVGALVSGIVAVLIALVSQGVWQAVVMLAVVLVVQQIEAHGLQPFLMGRAVRVHPLAVILSIAAGAVLAGIVGALLAVPTAAVLNTVVNHLAGHHVPDSAAAARSARKEQSGSGGDDDSGAVADSASTTEAGSSDADSGDGKAYESGGDDRH